MMICFKDLSGIAFKFQNYTNLAWRMSNTTMTMHICMLFYVTN